jgi:protein subunit release factor B
LRENKKGMREQEEMRRDRREKDIGNMMDKKTKDREEEAKKSVQRLEILEEKAVGDGRDGKEA